MQDTDIVITWVDGSTAQMMEKRSHYLNAENGPLHDNAINPHRWLCNDELGYCLRSIASHAPDIRRIWIVTDRQIPEYPKLPKDFLAKITIVDHSQIFAGYDASLPTFNSLSIETLLWRIPDLSEHFIYFNDDVFLTAPVEFSDFFTDDGPVLRGVWADHTSLLDCKASSDDAALLNHYNQIAAAEMAGFTAAHFFEIAHVAYPMQRSILAELYARHRDEFAANCAYRFRSTSQFLPQSLYNHHCLKNGLGRIGSGTDYLHIPANNSNDWNSLELETALTSLGERRIKFLCINDLPQIEQRLPDVRRWIDAAISR